MAIVGIPEAIHDFNMYLTGNKLGGITRRSGNAPV